MYGTSHISVFTQTCSFTGLIFGTDTDKTIADYPIASIGLSFVVLRVKVSFLDAHLEKNFVFFKTQSDDLLYTDHSIFIQLLERRYIRIFIRDIRKHLPKETKSHTCAGEIFMSVTGNLGKSVVNQWAFPYNGRRKVHMEQRQKPLKDLNLLDRFLFAQAADDPDTMRDILEIILGKEVVLKLLPQTEKEQRTHPLNPLCAAGCMGHG